jgi:hypothetical protein
LLQNRQLKTMGKRGPEGFRHRHALVADTLRAAQAPDMTEAAFRASDFYL